MTDKSFISISRCFVYAAPHITSFWLIAPIAIVQGVYAKYYGLSLTTIAAIVLVTRLFDGITDPLIGYFSDRYHRRYGTRKPFILVGGLLFIVSSYFLYVPFGFWTLSAPTQVGALYFTFWFIAIYLAWTLFEVPHIAWAAELASGSQEKTFIYSIRSMTGYLGMALFYVIPLLPMFATRDITPQTLQVSTIVANCFMLVFLALCLKYTPDSHHAVVTSRQNLQTFVAHPVGHLPRTAALKNEFRLLLRALINNKPFLIYVGANAFMGIGGGMWYAMIFIYVDAYLGLGAQFSLMFLVAFGIGIISAPLWYKLSIWLGKRDTWIFAVGLITISFLYTASLAPGNTSFSELLILKITQTLGYSCAIVIMPSILADIIDYDTWKTGSEKTATYFSLDTFTSKLNNALAAALGLAIAGWYGFDPSKTAHSEDSVWGLTLAITWIPTTFALIALLFILITPINAHRHAIIRRRLNARAARAIAADNLSTINSSITAAPVNG